jgi:hypothetical protein
MQSWAKHYRETMAEEDLDMALAYYKSPVGQKDLAAQRRVADILRNSALGNLDNVCSLLNDRSASNQASAASSTIAGLPRPDTARKTGYIRSRRTGRAMLLPEQLQRHALPAQLTMGRRPVRLWAPIPGQFGRRRRIEPCLNSGVVELLRQRPDEARLPSPANAIAGSRRAHPKAGGNLTLRRQR